MASLVVPDDVRTVRRVSAPSVSYNQSRRQSRLSDVTVPPSRRASHAPRSFFNAANDVKLRLQVVDSFRNLAIANTYKLGPDQDQRFKSAIIHQTATQILERVLGEISAYDALRTGALCVEIANQVKDAAKTQCPRHKVVCHVTLMENRKQGARSVSRCLWDAENDNMAVATYENNVIKATVTVFGVYHE